MAKCIVLIDGSNFYYKLKDLKLHRLLNFNFSEFSKMLVGDKNTIVSVTYYVGAVRTDGTSKAQKLFNEQRKLLTHLKRHTITYSLGYLMKSNDVFHE